MVVSIISRQKRVWLSVVVTVLLVSYIAVWKYSIPADGSTSQETTIFTHSSGINISQVVLNDTGAVCSYNNKDLRQLESNLSVIYFVTPTYSRAVQFPELLRLGQTLLHVPRLHWILVEDSDKCSPNVGSFLERLGIPYTHMINPMPDIFRKERTLPRGVSNRRAALTWLRSNVEDGVVYFGDDDNTFDLRLFEEIRDTKKVSMLPVALIGEYGISSPVVENGTVVGFFDPWPAGRQFPVDMAGFALNVHLLYQYPNATIPYKAGYEEDFFLQSLGLKMSDIEPKANNCTEILVWHTRTMPVKASVLQLPRHEKAAGLLQPLFNAMKQLGIASISTSGLKTSWTVN